MREIIDRYEHFLDVKDLKVSVIEDGVDSFDYNLFNKNFPNSNPDNKMYFFAKRVNSDSIDPFEVEGFKRICYSIYYDSEAQNILDIEVAFDDGDGKYAFAYYSIYGDSIRICNNRKEYLAECIKLVLEDENTEDAIDALEMVGFDYA